MPADDNSGKESSKNPVSRHTDAVQQDWLDLDKQDSAGETLKAKKWTTERSVVDDASHHGNIHTGTDQQVELDKDQRSIEDISNKTILSEEQGQKHTNSENPRSQSFNHQEQSFHYDSNTFTDDPGSVAPDSSYRTYETADAESIVTSAGGDPLLFEERINTPVPEDRAADDQRNVRPVAEPAVILPPREQVIEKPSIVASDPFLTPPAVLDKNEPDPEISAVIDGQDSGSVVEDGMQSVSGQLTIIDPNAEEEHFNAGTVEGIYGSLESAEDGSWTYILNNAAENVQQLDLGDTVTDTITITSVDGTSHDLTITVNGTNDQPVIQTITERAATEDGSPITGAVTVTDVDADDILIFSAQDVDGLTFNEDGSYFFDPSHTSYQSMAAGETRAISISVTVTDSHGASDSQNLIITLTGSNDTPSVSGAVTLPGGAEDTSMSFTADQLLANGSDIDVIDTLSVENVTVDTAQGTLTDNGNGTFTFTPRENYNGAVTISYDVTDGMQSVPATAAINLEAVNDAPIITSAETINISEDSMEGFTGYGEIWEGDVYSVVTQAEMLAHLGISDVDSDTFTVSLADAEVAWHGGIEANDTVFNSDTLASNSVNGDETVVQITQEFLDNYPNVDAEVGDFYFDHVDFDKLSDGEIAGINFSVQVSDGESNGEPHNLTIQVTGSNDGPVVSGEVTLVGGVEDKSHSFTAADLLTNTTDIDAHDTLSVINVSVDADHGTLTANPDGTFTFTPKENYNGAVTISYDVTDGIEIVSTSASLDLAAVNDNPIAVDDSAVNRQVLLDGNNSSLITDSSIIENNSEPYTVSLDITPEAQDYGYIISNGGQTGSASGFFVTRGVYGKDSSVYQVGVADENQFVIFQGGQVENGQQSNLTFTYDGQELIVYQDGVDITDTGTIITRAGRDLPMQSVTIGAPSNVPTLYEFKGETDNIQIYDTALDAMEVGQIQSGIIPDQEGLLVHYTFEGESSLTDQSGNGHSLHSNGDIQFTEVIDPELSTGEDSTLTINTETLLANDSDVDGDTLSITAVSEEVLDRDGKIVGTAVQDEDGNIIFTPGEALDSLADGESKEVSFTYTVSDGQGGTDTAMTTLNVQGTNDKPVVGSVDLGEIKEDSEIKFEASDLLKNSSDVDGDKLTVIDVSVDKEFGSIEFSTDREGNVETVKFIPNENFNGEDVPITFIAADGQVKVEGRATIDVTAVNDDPIAVDDTYISAPLIDPENTGELTGGATRGVRVTGIYARGSEENLLEGKPDLTTLSDHYYFDHGFADNGISRGELRGGIITFEDGTQGIIDTSSNGVARDRDGDGTIDYEENAYIYYSAYEVEGPLQTDEDTVLTITQDTLVANDTDCFQGCG